MRKMIFAVVFIGVVFFGFRYLQTWLTEPISEVNMTEEEEDKYLEELNEISGAGLQDTTMTTLKQCFEMAHAYDLYSCIGTMIIDEEAFPTADKDVSGKGKALYNFISNNKPIIEMDFERQAESTEDIGIYRVSFLLLQESKRPTYQFHVKENEVIKINKEAF